MLTRRALLRHLLTLPLAATLDLERLLWVPGQLVTVPAMRVPLDEITWVTCAQILPHIQDIFFQSTPLLAYLQRPRHHGVLRSL